jgi:hypothetical protein
MDQLQKNGLISQRMISMLIGKGD